MTNPSKLENSLTSIDRAKGKHRGGMGTGRSMGIGMGTGRSMCIGIGIGIGIGVDRVVCVDRVTHN